MVAQDREEGEVTSELVELLLAIMAEVEEAAAETAAPAAALLAGLSFTSIK